MDTPNVPTCRTATPKSAQECCRETEQSYGTCNPYGQVLSLSPSFEVPVVAQGRECIALLDSGATDNFISLEFSEKLPCRSRPLRHPFLVRVANGEILRVDKYLRVQIHFATVSIRMSLRIIPMTVPLILGCPFLLRWNPIIDWRGRTMTFGYRGRAVVVHATTSSKDSAYAPTKLAAFSSRANPPVDDSTAATAVEETFATHDDVDAAMAQARPHHRVCNTLLEDLLPEGAVKTLA